MHRNSYRQHRWGAGPLGNYAATITILAGWQTRSTIKPREFPGSTSPAPQEGIGIFENTLAVPVLFAVARNGPTERPHRRRDLISGTPPAALGIHRRD